MSRTCTRRPLGRYGYTIFYRALAGGEEIEVARVVHGARVRNLRQMPDDRE
jgi:plasmid stabilization system protein ParE